MMADRANDSIAVAIGKTDQNVMPYVWIRRDVDTDEWTGELGDSIKLGIDDGLLKERDPIEMFSLEQAILTGLANVEDDGVMHTINIPASNTPQPKKTQSQPKKAQKRSEKELQAEAKRMVDDLFKSLK